MMSADFVVARDDLQRCKTIETQLPDPATLPEEALCRWLITELGVAAIPLSAFYADGTEQRVVRFCYAKRDATLDTALERLARLG